MTEDLLRLPRSRVATVLSRVAKSLKNKAILCALLQLGDLYFLCLSIWSSYVVGLVVTLPKSAFNVTPPRNTLPPISPPQHHHHGYPRIRSVPRERKTLLRFSER